MRQRRRTKTALALAATLLAAALSAAAAHAAEPIGAVTLLTGEVTLSRAGYTPAQATLNERVYLGDLIQTAQRARARVSLADGSILSLAERSRVRLDEYVYSPPQGTRSVLAGLLAGKVKCLVSRLSGLTRNRFEVATPTAIIGTRGTVFVVAYIEATQVTQVFCLSEAVQVENLSFPGVRVTVTENLATAFGPHEAPPEPRPITPLQLEQLLQETAAGSGPAAPSEAPAAQGAQAAAGLLGGLESPPPPAEAPAAPAEPLSSPAGELTPAGVAAATPPLPPFVTIENVVSPLPGPPSPP